MKVKLLLMFLVIAALSTLAGAAEVAILNPGFEDPVLDDGKWTLNATGWQEGWYDLTATDPTAWTGYSWGAGAINPDADYGYGGIAPEGENVAFTTSDIGYDCGLSQILSATLQAGTTYELSALVGNPYVSNEGATCDYRIELVAGGVAVASDTGPSPANDTYWTTASLTFTPDGGHPQIGELLEIRLIAADYLAEYEVNFDDIRLNSYADPMGPSPYDGEFVYVGDVELSWTNMDPNEGVDSVFVDVWFGKDPNDYNDYNKVVTQGEDVNSVAVDASVEGTYYWRVDSYLCGDPTVVDYDIEGNDPNKYPVIKGRMYRFYATTDLPLEFVDAGDDMITWSGEAVQLEPSIDDDGVSDLTYAWSADPVDGTEVVFSDPNIEAPTVTITTVPYSAATIVNAGFEDPVLADGDWSYSMGNQGWGYFANDGYIGLQNPTAAAYPDEAPEGQNVGWAEPSDGVPGGFAQVLTETLASDTTYELTVEVGNPPGYTWGGYKVQLLAGGTPHDTTSTGNTGAVTGGTVLAEDDNSLTIAEGTFETSTVTHTTGGAGSDLNVGERLQIRLLAIGPNYNYEASFDDVRLTADPPFPPATGVQTVTLTVSVQDTAGSDEDTMTIDVYDNPCLAAIIGLGEEIDPGDFDENCITNIEDFAEMAEDWLVYYELTEPVEKP